MIFPISRTERAYILRLAASMGAFVFALLVMKIWFRSAQPPSGLWLYVAAVLPALPILAAIAAVGRYLVEETDEYLRTLLVRAVLWATGITMAVATVRDFLEDYAHIQPMEPGFVFFVFCAAFAVTQVVVRLRERT